MRILLDECVPRPIRRELPGHDVRTVTEMGWSGKQNGELLRLIQAYPFDVFLTVDQNLRYQQDLRGAGVAVIVLFARTNRLQDLAGLMSKVRDILAYIQSGELVEVGR